MHHDFKQGEERSKTSRKVMQSKHEIKINTQKNSYKKNTQIFKIKVANEGLYSVFN